MRQGFLQNFGPFLGPFRKLLILVFRARGREILLHSSAISRSTRDPREPLLQISELQYSLVLKSDQSKVPTVPNLFYTNHSYHFPSIFTPGAAISCPIAYLWWPKTCSVMQLLHSSSVPKFVWQQLLEMSFGTGQTASCDICSVQLSICRFCVTAVWKWPIYDIS